MSRVILFGFLLALAALLFAIRPTPPLTPDEGAAFAAGPVPPAPEGVPPVRLAVVLVFDQMRGDYVQKWKPYFSDRGFQRIQRNGVDFQNCYYPYATTTTGPGHSAILSGATLNATGIINNEWYDRGAAANVYCAGSSRYTLVPPQKETPPKAGEKAKSKPAGNPDLMLAETVADVLKAKTNGQGKVFGLSLKDRSGILPTGKRPNGVFWFVGDFVTSTYYSDVLPSWVTDFNKSGIANRWFGQEWTRYRPKLDYTKLAGPDNEASEANLNGQGITFPHPTTGGKPTRGKEYYEALANSPFGNELLFEFAKSCIEHEQLGQDDVPDLLVVSFSSNDLVGHTFGPDSHEVLDVTLRSDALVAKLMQYLDGRIGNGKYSVVISADHGICPMPEVSSQRGVPAKRVEIAKVAAAGEKHLSSKFGEAGGKAKWLEGVTPPWVYLNERLIAEKKLTKDAVAAELAAWLRTQPDFANAYTAEQIRSAAPTDEMLTLIRNAYHPARAGDVYGLLKPYYLFGDSLKATGTTHGSPYDYDRHVPLLVYGPGVSGGASNERVTPQHAAVITARFLGVPPPQHTSYTLPTTLAK